MYTIKDNISHEIEIKKSRFICNLIKINNLDEVDYYLEKIKEEHKFSKHNCYAYILGNNKKASDDKEPSGTAGRPMLNLLEVNELDHVLAITTRYFGGIKLGVGGLLRAYVTVLKEAIDEANIIEIKKQYKYKIKLDYKDIKFIENSFNDNITKKDFNDDIIYEIVTFDEIDEILNGKNIKIIDKEEI